MSIVTGITNDYYRRDMKGPCNRMLDEWVVSRLSRNTFELASEVAQIVSRDKIGNQPGKNPDIRFNVDSALLQRLLPKTVEEAIKPELSSSREGSLQRVLSVIEQYRPKKPCSIVNPHRKTNEERAGESLDFGRNLFESYNFRNGFIKHNLTEPFQKISCFEYVVNRLNLRKELMEFRRDRSQARTGSNDDFAIFLLAKGFQYASLPFQENDIIGYFNDSGKLMHAALVAEDTTRVYGKFGNDTPFAYLHPFEEAPFLHGQYYRIFRRS